MYRLLKLPPVGLNFMNNRLKHYNNFILKTHGLGKEDNTCEWQSSRNTPGKINHKTSYHRARKSGFYKFKSRLNKDNLQYAESKINGADIKYERTLNIIKSWRIGKFLRAEKAPTVRVQETHLRKTEEKFVNAMFKFKEFVYRSVAKTKMRGILEGGSNTLPWQTQLSKFMRKGDM